MVDVHDRRPVVLEPADAWRWIDPETPVEEAAHIAQSRSLPTEAFTWWRVSPQVNRVDPGNNGEHLLAPIEPALEQELAGQKQKEITDKYTPDFSKLWGGRKD
jgi:putative SOS response-associated peptidase YedK